MNHFIQSSIILMLCGLFAKCLGFVREVVLAYSYGTSATTDAYLVGAGLASTLAYGIFIAISTGYIAVYSKMGDRPLQGQRFTTAMILLVVAIGVAIYSIYLLFAAPITKLFAFGFDVHTFAMTVSIGKLAVFSCLFHGIYLIFSGYLQVHNRFAITGLASIPLNICYILSIVIAAQTDYLVLGYGVIVAQGAMMLFLLPSVWKSGWRFKLSIDGCGKEIKSIVLMAMPIFIGLTINQINVIIDRALASTLVVGTVSALNYAQRLNAFIYTLFIVSIATVIFPHLSRLGGDKDYGRIKVTLNNGLTAISIFILPITVGAIVFAKPIVMLLFQRGAFDGEATVMTTQCLVFYIIGLIGMGYRELITKVFYGLEDSRTPMINGAIGIGVNIGLNLLLISQFKHMGLAFATSVSAILTAVLLMVSLKRKMKGMISYGSLGKKVSKMVLAAVVMGFVAIGCYSWLLVRFQRFSLGEIMALALAIGLGAMVYFIQLYLFKIDEVQQVINRFLKIKSP